MSKNNSFHKFHIIMINIFILLFNNYIYSLPSIHNKDNNTNNHNGLNDNYLLDNIINKTKGEIFVFETLENYFFIFLNNNMYLFSNIGELIQNCIFFEQIPEYKYQIIEYKNLLNKSNLYYFIFVNIDNENNIVLNIYEYNYLNNSNNIILSSKINIIEKDINLDNNFSCQLIQNIDNDDMLFCFFKNKITNELIYKSFKINIKNNEINNNNIKKSLNYFKITGNLKKSIKSKDNNKILLLLVENKNIYKYINFDIITNNFNESISYLNNNDSLKNKSDNKFNIEYINNLNEYIFYLFIDNNKINIVKMNEDFQIINKKVYKINNNTIKDCIHNFFISIIYKSNNYYISYLCHLNKYPIIKYAKLKESNDILFKRKLQENNNDNNNNDNNNNKDYYVDFDKKETNIPKKEIKDNQDSIMSQTSSDQSYKIKGDGYEIKISQMGQKDETSITSIDFGNCETKLRNNYSLDDSDIIKVFQLELYNTNNKSITNNIKYTIYNENNKQMNLSVCAGEKIIINYNLKENTTLDVEMISNYLNEGIDILDSNHDFFNDICYSYSSNGSDMTLQDRISELYQNYSICDSGCDYMGIDTENLTVICSCSVSDDENDDESENLKDIILNLFENSTFGVIKCYKLFFSKNNKLKNIGFWIFLIIIVGHIPLYILFFIEGIKPIKKFISTEMRKFSYFLQNQNSLGSPPKKNEKNSENNSDNDLPRKTIEVLKDEKYEITTNNNNNIDLILSEKKKF